MNSLKHKILLVSDCENCCRLISVSAKVDGGQVELIEAIG
jgi:hypothetical protein